MKLPHGPTSLALLALTLALPVSSLEIPASTSLQAQSAPFERTEEREPCNNYDPLRRPFYGDTHVHTALSFDAAGQDTRNKPADAYAFARGSEMAIQPYDENGRSLRSIKLDRALDFTAVTDHSEFIGEMFLCTNEGAEGYMHPVCLAHRNFPQFTQLFFGGYGLSLKRRWGFCGEEGENCRAATANVWQSIQEAAEQAYDRTADCEFTSFVAYEWTGTVGRGSNIHHNVIFRNDKVPDQPMSWLDTPSQVQLWDYFDSECVEGIPGCDGISIPHNSNLSGGIIFESARVERNEIPPGPVSAEEAARRAHYNPLFEVMQHKGSSECDSRLPIWSEDEFCDFEKLSYDTFGTKNTGDDGSGMLYWMKKVFGGADFNDVQPPGESSFLRYALKKGLQQQAVLGVNSFKYGLISSTDTHIAAPGLAMEKNHPGHGGAGMGSGGGLPVGLPDELEFNPGGLAVLYAEENSRDSLFAAMRRREAYATSGTRPTLRFFGGWGYAKDVCAAPDMVAQGYAGGVPMGGDLSVAAQSEEEGEGEHEGKHEGDSERRQPTFILSAQADAGTPDYPGNDLQRIQVVKGWYVDGELKEAVLDVAGGANDASVDLNTCATRGSGHKQLCTVWRDEQFNADAHAFYYARVLENPSCRWSQHLCADAGVRCDAPSTIPTGMENCCAAEHKKTVQERAWSSPIWYTPPGQGTIAAQN